MRKHFAMAYNPDMAAHMGIETRDSDTYYAHEDVLNEQFTSYRKEVEQAVQSIITPMRAQGFRGQRSMDVMVNNADSYVPEFYLIDMAPMCESALVDELNTVGELRYSYIDTICYYAERKY